MTFGEAASPATLLPVCVVSAFLYSMHLGWARRRHGVQVRKVSKRPGQTRLGWAKVNPRQTKVSVDLLPLFYSNFALLLYK